MLDGVDHLAVAADQQPKIVPFKVGPDLVLVLLDVHVRVDADARDNALEQLLHACAGDAHVSLVDVAKHTMVVRDNGRVVRTMPISAGRDKYPTMGGVHIALEKSYHVVMDSSTVGIPVNSPDGYKEDVYWNVAITNGGEYVHAAPWSVGAQGSRNVSHGCVNLSPSDATWFYNYALPGDIINIIGTPRRPSASDAGTADWNMGWDKWVEPVT